MVGRPGNMCDLTPVIEGPVKFRDGKKVREKLEAADRPLDWFLSIHVFAHVSVEGPVRLRHPSFAGCR